jgi:hypothetical protein
MTTRLGSTLALALVLLAADEAPLHAYIDPGTGSMVVQGIIAAIAGAAVMIRMSWARIRTLFGRGTDTER